MFTLPNVMNFFPHEFTGLSGRRLSFRSILARTI
jgi:hypothetical protein